MRRIQRLAELWTQGSMASVYWNGGVSIASTTLQNVFSAVLFILLARHFGPVELSNYVIAFALYQLVGVVIPLGLMQYFVREYSQDPGHRVELTRRLIVVEFFTGAIGLALIVSASVLINYNEEIRLLALILGVNVLFDNLLYCVRAVSIAENRQFYVSFITLLEAFLKMVIGITMMVIGLSLVHITLLIVALRIMTVIVAIASLDRERETDFRFVLSAPQVAGFFDVRRMLQFVGKAKDFAVIATVSLVYWRLNVLILSKLAPAQQVSYYEVGAKVFAMFQVFPILYVTALYPVLSRAYQSDVNQFCNLGRSALVHLSVFAICVSVPVAFAAKEIINTLFGSQYQDAGIVGAVMLWTLVPFSVGLVQAYLLLASTNERLDMWINVVAVCANGMLCYGLIPRFGAGGAALAIVVSFSLFFVVQQVALHRKHLHVWHGIKGKICLLFVCHLLAVSTLVHVDKVFALVAGQILFWVMVFALKLIDIGALGRVYRMGLRKAVP